MFVELLISVVIAICSYWWYCYYYYYKYLKCIPSPKVYPIIGCALKFGKYEDSFDPVKMLMYNLKSKTIRLHVGFQTLIETTDYNLVSFILSSPNLIEKGTPYDYIQKWLGRGLLTNSGSQWRKHRKMITPTFHFKCISQYLNVINLNGKILINKLKTQIGNPSVDVSPIISLYTLDIIWEAALNTVLNAQLEESTEYIKAESTLCTMLHRRFFNPLYHSNFLYKWSALCREETAALKVLRAHTGNVINKRRHQLQLQQQNEELSIDNFKASDLRKNEKLAFIDLLMLSTIDGMPLTDEEIRNEVDTFVLAGHDTTAACISFALFLLANNPDVQQKAYEEVYNIFENDKKRPCTSADISRMIYLEKVIKETMRMYPPVPEISRKVLQDFTHNGITYPKMISIAINIYLIHHDPDHFPNPEKFDPERFAPENNKNRLPFSYIPFSAGSRNCIGEKFGMMEIKTSLSTILRNFELKPATPKHNLKLVSVVVLRSLNGIKVSFHERT